MIKTLKSKWLLLLIYIYLFLPTIIFLTFWTKFIIGIPLSIFTIIGIYLSLKDENKLNALKLDFNNKATLLLVLSLIVLIVLTSGIGASVPQYPDHIFRNSMFKVLTNYDWPITLYNPNGKLWMLDYYFGFWLPAALIAKATTLQDGLVFLQIWAVIGIFISYILVCYKQKKIRLWFFIVFIFFGGLDYIGTVLVDKLIDQVGNRYEWWAAMFNYPGFFTSLFWVFNQCIYAWIVYQLIMLQTKNKNLLLIWSTSLLTCPIPAAGMLPFVIYQLIKNTKTIHIKQIFNNSKSWQNLIGVLIIFIIGTFLIANEAAYNGLKLLLPNFWNKVFAESNFQVLNTVENSFNAYPRTTNLFIYLWFILLEFGIYYIVIYKLQKHNPLYYISLIFLLICPFIKVGYWIDFGLRANIPSLFCLYELTIDAIEKYFKQKNKLYLSFIIIILMISSITCFDTLLGIMNPQANNFNEHKHVQVTILYDEYLVSRDNFIARTDSFFAKYIAKDFSNKKH